MFLLIKALSRFLNWIWPIVKIMTVQKIIILCTFVFLYIIFNRLIRNTVIIPNKYLTKWGNWLEDGLVEQTLEKITSAKFYERGVYKKVL